MNKTFDRILWRLFKINLANTDDRNAWLLVVEMFWASILISVITFNAAYAIRLGADNVQVSLLTSIPALMAVLVSVPAGQFLSRRARRAPWVFGAILIYRFGFLAVAAVPLLKLGGLNPGATAVVILVLVSIPAHFFNVGWIPMLAEVILEQRRAAVFAARNIINQAMLSVSAFLIGLWLSRAAFPFNYQVIYLVGFATSMLSMYNLYRLRVPDSPVRAPAQTAPEGSESTSPEAGGRPLARPAPRAVTLGARVQAVRETFTQQPAFTRITLNTLLHGVGIWMAAPLYALYYVRTLNAPDSWLGLNATLASLGTIAGFSFWRWLIVRWGEPVSLKRTIVLLGLYPAVVGLTPSLPVILIYGVLNGLVVPGVTLSHFTTLLKVTPPDARPHYTAIYMTVMNIGAFICPLISVAIAEVIGLAPTLVIAGLLSVVGSTSFWWQPVVRQEEAVQPAV